VSVCLSVTRSHKVAHHARPLAASQCPTCPIATDVYTSLRVNNTAFPLQLPLVNSVLTTNRSLFWVSHKIHTYNTQSSEHKATVWLKTIVLPKTTIQRLAPCL